MVRGNGINIWFRRSSRTTPKTFFACDQVQLEHLTPLRGCPTLQGTWYKLIWSGPYTPKLKLFIWQVAQNGIATGENLLHRGLLDRAGCPHCGDLETLDHLLFTCDAAKQVWSQLPITTHFDTINTNGFMSTLATAKNWITLPPTGISATQIFPWVCWAIWKSRNIKLFETRQIDAQETITNAISAAREWSEVQEKDAPTKSPIINPRGAQNPNLPTDHYIYKTDAAWDAGTNNAGLGWICMNNRNQILQENSQFEPYVHSPLMAEALAILSALHHAREMNISSLNIQSDAQILVRAISAQEKIKEISGILFDIYSLSLSFTSVSFSYLRRSENLEADALAKSGLQNSCIFDLSF